MVYSVIEYYPEYGYTFLGFWFWAVAMAQKQAKGPVQIDAAILNTIKNDMKLRIRFKCHKSLLTTGSIPEIGIVKCPPRFLLRRVLLLLLSSLDFGYCTGDPRGDNTANVALNFWPQVCQSTDEKRRWLLSLR